MARVLWRGNVTCGNWCAWMDACHCTERQNIEMSGKERMKAERQEAALLQNGPAGWSECFCWSRRYRKTLRHRRRAARQIDNHFFLMTRIGHLAPNMSTRLLWNELCSKIQRTLLHSGSPRGCILRALRPHKLKYPLTLFSLLVSRFDSFEKKVKHFSVPSWLIFAQRGRHTALYLTYLV